MKNNRIAVRGDNTLEGTISLAPAVAALRSRYPESEIIFVGNESMREAVGLLPGVNGFSSDFNSVNPGATFSISGPAGSESVDWKIYLEGPALGAEGNPYHHIDLLRKVVGADLVDVNFELIAPSTDTSIFPPGLLSGEEGLRIAICVGSLEISELEAILQGISSLTIPREVYLMGTVKDKKKSSEIVSRRDGQLAIHDLCGRLTLTQFSQVLRSADVCIAGPGSSTLLSSGYGTFTVCFDNQPKRGPLHYPYGHGHLVIQSTAEQDFAASIGLLTREILEYAVRANTGSVPTLDQWQAFADSRLDEYLGKIRLLATQRIEIVLDEEKRLTELYLRPLIYLGSEASDVMETFYRLLWEHSLNARTLTSEDIEMLHQDTVASICTLLAPLEKLFELSKFGHSYCQLVKKALTAGDVGLAQQESSKVQEVEELVFKLSESFPALSALCAFHGKSQAHIPELDAVDMAEEMSDVFADLQSRVLVVLDLAKTLFHTTFQKESAQLAESSPVEGLSDG